MFGISRNLFIIHVNYLNYLKGFKEKSESASWKLLIGAKAVWSMFVWENPMATSLEIEYLMAGSITGWRVRNSQYLRRTVSSSGNKKNLIKHFDRFPRTENSNEMNLWSIGESSKAMIASSAGYSMKNFCSLRVRLRSII